MVGRSTPTRSAYVTLIIFKKNKILSNKTLFLRIEIFLKLILFGGANVVHTFFGTHVI